MNELLEKIEAIDMMTSLLEELGTELISHPDIPTETYQVKGALAWANVLRALRIVPTPLQPPVGSQLLFDLETENRISTDDPNAAPA